jgi:hypothetical protein
MPYLRVQFLVVAIINSIGFAIDYSIDYYISKDIKFELTTALGLPLPIIMAMT